MRYEIAQLRTEDGTCPTHELHPEGGEPLPGVIVFMDALGVRPAMLDVARGIAAGGYHVAMPDLYHRSGAEPPTWAMLGDPVARAEWSTHVVPTMRAELVMRDVAAILAHFDARPDVVGDRIGVVGYCMGGRLAFFAAGSFPDRIAACASYHASGLATDAPDSPHRLAPRMRGRIYIAGAIEDRGFDDAQKLRLEQALTDAGVDHLVETYPARHGWVMADAPVHDPEQTERHWRTLFALLDEELKGKVGAGG